MNDLNEVIGLEIGLVVLAIALIGMLIGWLLGRSRGSKGISQVRNRYEGELHQRDREIHRLQSRRPVRDTSADGRTGYAKGQPSARSREVTREVNRGVPASGHTRSGVESRGTSDDLVMTGAATIKRPPIAASGANRGQSAGARSEVTQKITTRRPAIGAPGKYSVAAKDIRGDSASLRVQGPAADSAADIGKLKQAVDDEAYAKVKALAALGERDRQLQYSYTPQPAQVTTTVRQPGLDRYQKELQQKNSQVDDLQRKVRELLASQSTQTRTTETVGLTSVKERQLKSNIEQESFEKVRAFAGWGEAERKLSLMSEPAVDPEIAPLRRRAEQQDTIIADLRKRLEAQQQQTERARQEAERKLSMVKPVEKPAPDPDIVPLRRRAEQQDSIIVDLRKRIEKQQLQLDDTRRDYDKKISSREADLATLRAEISAPNPANQAEVDSYKRQVSELELASQKRIKEFNTTLENRNKEYDQLGLRLEELRGQVADRDTQITRLKTDIEKQNSLKSSLDAELNRHREQVGALQVDLKERDGDIVRLKAATADLESSKGEVRGMEEKLSLFTRNTEESAKKYEGVINNQRIRIEELEARQVDLQAKVKDGESKFTTVTADVTASVLKFLVKIQNSASFKKICPHRAVSMKSHRRISRGCRVLCQPKIQS